MEGDGERLSVLNDALSGLEHWYAAHCDGDWEHGYGVRIDTLDNPGWIVTIDLEGTRKADSPLHWQKIEHSEDNWIHYKAENKKFEIRCGPLNLTESIDIFLRWFGQ